MRSATIKGSLAVAVLLASGVAAFAQGPAGEGSGATIPGNDVRAGEQRPIRMEPGVTTGMAPSRVDRRPEGDVIVRDRPISNQAGAAAAGVSPDATQDAPAGR